MADWTTVDQVKAALGLEPADTTDDDWLIQVVAAANQLCSRRRSTAGYIDPDPPTDPAAMLGTQLYAMSLYRERGAADGIPSMAELGVFVPTGGSWGQIQRLWGVNRPQVDTPAVGDLEAVRRRELRL